MTQTQTIQYFPQNSLKKLLDTPGGCKNYLENVSRSFSLGKLTPEQSKRVKPQEIDFRGYPCPLTLV